ncbi:hypothetical protein B296_00029850 [Ensete ventricosum]|uniref:Uncharacterized protein n=1 Tax=Ensete ventricosum TaxID=4639 RepID=A0A426Y8S1_ENSVE|nr:hypothetical protein B296_00029850 [Ensete ventricosum]
MSLAFFHRLPPLPNTNDCHCPLPSSSASRNLDCPFCLTDHTYLRIQYCHFCSLQRCPTTPVSRCRNLFAVAANRWTYLLATAATRRCLLPPSLPSHFFTVAKPSSTATLISSAFSSLCHSHLCRTCSYSRPSLFSSPAIVATRCCSRPSSPLPSSSIAAGPLPLKHQQRSRYLAAPHLLGAPHDAATSSLATAALAAVATSNCAPCHCFPSLPLLAPHPVAAATDASSYYHCCPPSSLTSFSIYW